MAIARQGIICMEGKAGTIQEIFQDGVHTYYQTFGQISPMILFGVDYWRRDYPVASVLLKLFAAEFVKYVLVTDSVNDAVEFIDKFSSVV